jgi:RHS repeat-associated protein
MGKKRPSRNGQPRSGNSFVWNPLIRGGRFVARWIISVATNNACLCFAAGVLSAYALRAVGEELATEPKARPGSSVATVPATSVKGLDLSRAPSTEELTAAGQLGAPLFPTHELKDKGREAAARWGFGKAIEEWNKHEYPKAVRMLRAYLADYPDSPWAAEAELHIGCDAAYNGRTSEAETIFNKLIAEHQGNEYPGARMLLSKARQRLAVVEAEQNNLEGARLELRSLLLESPDWRHRTYASHWLMRLSQFEAAKQALANCGAEALAYALKKKGLTAAASQVRTNLPATMRGHSLAALARMAGAQGMEMAGLLVTEADVQNLSLPAIVQVRPRHPGNSGHYWVLDKAQSGHLELYDPQSDRRLHQTVEELAKEWTGRVLVFGMGGTIPGRRLQVEEMEESSGGCCGVPRKEDGLGNPDPNPQPPDQCSSGAPRWSVNVINMNLFATDTLLWYTPPVGSPVQITLSYNSQSAIAQYEPFGNKWQFNYGTYLVVDTAGTITVFMPDGRRDAYTPDGTGGYSKPYRVFNTLTQLAPNHFELRFPDDTVYVYRIPAGTSSQQPFLTEIRDAHNQKLSFGYDSNVHLTTITDAQGQVTTLSYDGSGLVTNVADPFGRNASFEYDSNQNLTRSTDMGGYWSGYAYDSNVYLTSISNERGSWSFRIEPADGIENGPNPYPPPGGAMFQNYRITITDPLGNSSEYHYDGYSSYAWYVSPRDYVPWTSAFANNFKLNVPKTLYHFAAVNAGQRGELGRIDYPEGDYVNYFYDLNTGGLTYLADAHGNTWLYSYNSMGRVTSVMDAKGTLTSLTYGTNGVDLASFSDNLGQIGLVWDGQHDVLSIKDRLGNSSSFAYNSFGQLTSWVDALGITNSYVYDSSNRLAQFQRAGQALDVFAYDAIGRVRTHTDATGLTVTNDYNSLNQITRVSYPDGKFEGYTYSTCCPRLLDSATDRGGRSTLFSYDALKRLVQTVNAEGGITQFGYDPDGNLINLVDPNGNATTFAYDFDNHLVSKAYAGGQSVSYGYDDAGLLVARTNAQGSVIKYLYDENHNLTAKLYSDGTPNVTNSYDGSNRLIQVTDGIGTRTYAYDANFRLVSSTGPWANETTTYAYDAAGRGTNITTQPVQKVSYGYDSENRLVQVQTSAGNIAYGYSGVSPLIQTLAYPNGTFETNAYDLVNRLALVSNRKSTQAIINQFAYTYGPQDLRASETATQALQTNYSQNQSLAYQYNQLNQVSNSSAGAQVFLFDNDGNMTRGLTADAHVFTASYDAENQLTSLFYTNAAGVLCSNSYAYTADSLLAIFKQYTNGVPAGETRFVRALGLPLQERDGANNVVREYAWGRFSGGGIGGLLNVTQGGQNYFYLYDGKGNVTAVLDGSQNTVAAYAYDAFGQLEASSGALNQPMQFSTKWYDGQSGLAYFGFRFYNPRLGRWLNRDPLGEPAGLNAYTYVHNNPINRNDPTGLDDGFSSSPGGLGPQLNFNYGNFSGQLQAPWLYPGSGYSGFDLTLNLNLTPNFALVCDASTRGFGVDVKNLGPFEVQLTGSGLNSGQLQITIDTGNPNIGAQAQVTWGPQGPNFTFGAGGRF